MDSDFVRVQQLAEKLAHATYSVRDRAIKNLISKIEHNIIDVQAEYNSSLDVILSNVKVALSQFSDTDTETDINGENLSYMLSLCRLVILLGNASSSNKHVASKMFASILDSLYLILNASSLDAGIAERIQAAVNSILALNGNFGSGNREGDDNYNVDSETSSYSSTHIMYERSYAFPPTISTTNTSISTPASGAGLVLQSPLCQPNSSAKSIYCKPSPLSSSDSKSLFDLEVRLAMDINNNNNSKTSKSVIDQLYQITLDFPVDQLLSRSSVITQVMNIVGAIHLSDSGSPSDINTNHPDKNIVVILVNWLTLVMERAILLFDNHHDGGLCTYLPAKVVDSENLQEDNGSVDKHFRFAESGDEKSDLSVTKTLTHSMYLLRDPVRNSSSNNSKSGSVNYVDMYEHAADIIAAKYGAGHGTGASNSNTSVSLSGFAFACVAVTLPLLLSANVNNYGEVLKLVDICMPFISEPRCCPGDIESAQMDKLLSVVDISRYQHILNRLEQIIIFINSRNTRLDDDDAEESRVRMSRSIVSNILKLFERDSDVNNLSNMADNCWQACIAVHLIKIVLSIPSNFYHKANGRTDVQDKLQLGVATLSVLQEVVIFRKAMSHINEGENTIDTLIAPLVLHINVIDPDFSEKLKKLEMLYYHLKVIKNLSSISDDTEVVIDAVFGSVEILMNPLFDQNEGKNGPAVNTDYISLMSGLSKLVSIYLARLFFACEGITDHESEDSSLTSSVGDLVFRVLLSTHNKEIRNMMIAEMTNLLKKTTGRIPKSDLSDVTWATYFDQFVMQSALRSRKDAILSRVISLNFFKVIGYIIIADNQDYDEALGESTTAEKDGKPIHLLNLMCEIVNSVSSFNEARDSYPSLFLSREISNHTVTNNESDLLVILKVIEWKFKYPSAEGTSINMAISDTFSPRSLFSLSEKIETYYSESNKSVYCRILILGLFYNHMTLRNTSVLKLLFEISNNSERSRLMSLSKSNKDFISDVTMIPLFTIFAKTTLKPPSSCADSGEGSKKKNLSPAPVTAANLFNHSDVRKIVRIIVNSDDVTVLCNALSQLHTFLSDANILKTCEMSLLVFTVNAIVRCILNIHSEYLLSKGAFHEEEKESIINGLKVIQYISFSLKSINNFIVFDYKEAPEGEARNISDRFVNICPILSLLFANNASLTKSIPSVNSITLHILFSFALHFDSFFDSVLANNVGSKTIKLQANKSGLGYQAELDPSKCSASPNVPNAFVGDFVLPVNEDKSSIFSATRSKDNSCCFFNYTFTSTDFVVSNYVNLDALKAIARANHDFNHSKSQYIRRLMGLFSSPQNSSHSTNNTILMLNLASMNCWQTYGDTLLQTRNLEKQLRDAEAQGAYSNVYEGQSTGVKGKRVLKGQGGARRDTKFAVLPPIVANVFAITPNSESDFITMYNSMRFVESLCRHLSSSCSSCNYVLLVEFLIELRDCLLSAKMVDFLCGYSYNVQILAGREASTSIFRHCTSIYVQLLTSYIELWGSVKTFLDPRNNAPVSLKGSLDEFTSTYINLSNPLFVRCVSKCVEVLVIEDESHNMRIKALVLLTSFCRFDAKSLNSVLFNKLNSSVFEESAMESHLTPAAPSYFNHLLSSLLLLRSPDSFRGSSMTQQLLLLLTLSLNQVYISIKKDPSCVTDSLCDAFSSIDLNRFSKLLFERKSQIKIATVNLLSPVMGIMTIINDINFNSVNSYCKLYGSLSEKNSSSYSGAIRNDLSMSTIRMGTGLTDHADSVPPDMIIIRDLVNMITSLLYVAEDQYESVCLRLGAITSVNSIHRLLVFRDKFDIADGTLTFITMASTHFQVQKRIAILSDLIDIETWTGKSMTWGSIQICVGLLQDIVDLALSINTNKEVLLSLVRDSIASMKLLPKLIKLFSDTVVQFVEDKKIANIFGNMDNDTIRSASYTSDLRSAGNYVVNISNFNAFKDGDMAVNRHVLSWSVLSNFVGKTSRSRVSFLSGATRQDAQRYTTYMLSSKLIQCIDSVQNSNNNYEVLRNCFDRTHIFGFVVNILHELQYSEECRDVSVDEISFADLGRLRMTKFSLMLCLIQMVNTYMKSCMSNMMDPHDKDVIDDIADKSFYMGRIALTLMTSIDVSVDKLGIETLTFAILLSFSEFLFIIYNNSCILSALENDNNVFKSELFTKIPSFLISWILNIENGSKIDVNAVSAALVSNVKNRLSLLLAIICRSSPVVAKKLVDENVINYPIGSVITFCDILSNINNSNNKNNNNSSSIGISGHNNTSAASGHSARAALSAKSKLGNVRSGSTATSNTSGNGTNNGIKGAFIAKPVDGNKWRNQTRGYTVNSTSSPVNSSVNISMRNAKSIFLDPWADFKPSNVFISLLLLQNSMLQSPDMQNVVAERLDKAKLLLLLQTAQQSSLAISSSSPLSHLDHKEVVALIWGFLFSFVNGNRNNQKLLLTLKESVVKTTLASSSISTSDNNDDLANSAVFHLLLNNGLSCNYPASVRIAQLFLLRACISSGSFVAIKNLPRLLFKPDEESSLASIANIEALNRKKIVYAKIIIKLIERIVKESTSNVSDNYLTSNSANSHFSNVSMVQIATLVDILTGCICPEPQDTNEIATANTSGFNESTAALLSAFNNGNSGLSELTNHELNGLFGDLSDLIKWLNNAFVISAASSNNYSSHISSYSLISMSLLRLHGRIAYTFAIADEETRFSRKIGSPKVMPHAASSNNNMITSSRGRYLALLSSDSTLTTIIKTLIPSEERNGSVDATLGNFTLAFTSLVTLLVIVFNSEKAKANFKLLIKDQGILASESSGITNYAFTNPKYYRDMNERLFEKFKDTINLACITIKATLSDS